MEKVWNTAELRAEVLRAVLDVLRWKRIQVGELATCKSLFWGAILVTCGCSPVVECSNMFATCVACFHSSILPCAGGARLASRLTSHLSPMASFPTDSFAMACSSPTTFARRVSSTGRAALHTWFCFLRLDCLRFDNIPPFGFGLIVLPSLFAFCLFC